MVGFQFIKTLVICLVLAFVSFKLKYNRVRFAKLANYIVWGLVIFVGLVNTWDILRASNGMLSVLQFGFMSVIQRQNVRIIFWILLVINLITIDNKFKAIIVSIAQIGMTIIAPAIIIIAVLLIMTGNVGAFAGIGGDSSTSDSTGYSYDQNNEARNKGYSNALDAERSGRKWNGSTWE